MKNLFSVALSLCLALAAVAAAAAGTGDAAGGWREEFEAVCSKTDASLTLTEAELAQLVARCDRLAEVIGTEPEVVKRVFLKRLATCRALFAYVLDAKQSAPAESPAGPPGDAAVPAPALAPAPAPAPAPHAEAEPGAASAPVAAPPAAPPAAPGD